MKIEHAYSIDLEDSVDIDTAYELYAARRILDKHNFRCLYEGCDGHVTAANLDKLRQDMSVDPHFRRVKEETHTADCLRHASRDESAADTDDTPGRKRPRKDEALADEFILSRPESHKVAVHTAPGSGGASGRPVRRRGAAGGGTPQPRKSYSVGSLVSRYGKYRRRGIAGEMFVSIKGYRLSYEEMFVPVAGQPVDTLSDYPRVYFGRARVDEMTDSYRIGFVDALLVDGLPCRPSFFISKEQIEKAFSRRLFEAKFVALSQSRSADTWFFVYARPESTTSKGRTYINFRVSNLDLVDFRNNFLEGLAAENAA